MKDLTVYTKYSTFINQLTETEDVIQYNSNMTKEDISQFIEQFGAVLSKPGFSQNDMYLNFSRRCTVNNEHRDVHTRIYVPCVDHYQKQYNVFVIHRLENPSKVGALLVTKTQYKEAVNPLCITNANIKDIISEQNFLAMTDVFNA